MMHPHDYRDASPSRVARIVFWVLAAVAAFYLLTEHRAHVFGALPYVLLLACPIMHFFHHRGHGHGHGGSHGTPAMPPDPPSDGRRP